MKTKILYSLLAMAIIFFASSFYTSYDYPPAFKKSYAKKLMPSQASTFDYSRAKDTAEKKQIFFNTLRPIIENQNQLIRDKRQHVIFARNNKTDINWVKEMSDKYNIEWNENKPDWDQLLFRIDTIPVELVMTQAANESAWGQSRFAQQGNNLFGQWCFKKGCGIVPSQRNSGTHHEVKKFQSINQSVASYMHNINTTRAYEGLRKVRATLRTENRPLSALVLATGLEKYSSRGKAYVKEIQSMIKTNLPLMQGLNRSKK